MTDAQMTDQRVAKYLRLQWQLEDEIRQGKYPVGGKLPSHCELMRLYDCSCVTVTRALGALVADGLITRKRRAGTIVNKRPEPLPAVPAPSMIGLEQTLGFYHCGFPQRYHPYYSTLVDGLMWAADQSNMSIKMTRVPEGGLRFDKDFLAMHGLAGVIMTNARASELAAAEATGLPFVYLRGNYPQFTINRVQHGCGSTQMALAHFRDLGHKRVAIVDSRGSGGHLEAAGEVFDCLAENTPVDLFHEDKITPTGAKEVVEQILQHRPLPTALYCTDDIAMGFVWQELEARGVDIPNEMAIVGYGSQQSAMFMRRPATMVENNPFLSGQRAVERIHELLANPHSPASTVEIPLSLVVRGSCGTPAG